MWAMHCAVLYRKCGFVETGEVIDGEIVIELDLQGQSLLLWIREGGVHGN
jgi:hypothetical protein